MLAGSQLKDFMTFDLEGGHVLTITAVLSGGRGSIAWQHAQLFRQNLDDSDFPFEVILHLGWATAKIKEVQEILVLLA